MPTPQQIDPTRTRTLRAQYSRKMLQTLTALRKEITLEIGTKNIFDLSVKTSSPLTPSRIVGNLTFNQYRFLTDEQKLKAFEEWITLAIQSKILFFEGDSIWTKQYIQSAWRKGVTRAWIDANRHKLLDENDFYQGTKANFLQTAFGAPESLSKIQFLATRSFNGMKGLTDSMKSQLNFILAQGIAEGRGPRYVARLMNEQIAGMSRRRALTIARTEIIAAHAEGMLDSFERLGISEVEAEVEFSTAGDDRVCSQCASLEGETYTIKEARGIIPVHPNCRCSWIGVVKV